MIIPTVVSSLWQRSRDPPFTCISINSHLHIVRYGNYTLFLLYISFYGKITFIAFIPRLCLLWCDPKITFWLRQILCTCLVLLDIQLYKVHYRKTWDSVLFYASIQEHNKRLLVFNCNWTENELLLWKMKISTKTLNNPGFLEKFLYWIYILIDTILYLFYNLTKLSNSDFYQRYGQRAIIYEELYQT